MNATWIILISIVLSSLGHAAMKMGADKLLLDKASISISFLVQVIENKFLIAGVCFHIGALILWVIALNKVDLTYAYPFLALGYVLVSVIGFAFLNEPISTARLIGMALVVFGLALIIRSG